MSGRPTKKSEQRPERRQEDGAARRPAKLTVASSPHMAGRDSTRMLMLDVLIALMPALIFSGCYFFGPWAFVVTAVSAAGCCLLLTGRWGWESMVRPWTQRETALRGERSCSSFPHR